MTTTTSTNSSCYIDTDDLALRAPLHTATTTIKKIDAVIDLDAAHHNDVVRPIISCVLIGGRVLKLSAATKYTAAVLVHRYYYNNKICRSYYHQATSSTSKKKTAASENTVAAAGKAFHDNNNNNDDDDDEWKYVAAACLFLACKRHEEPRRLRDVINFARMIDLQQHNQTNNNNEHGAADAVAVVLWNPEPPKLDTDESSSHYWQSKKRLVQTENNVLRWLAFDVAVSYPHHAVSILLTEREDDNVKVVADNNHNRENSILSLLSTAAMRRLNDSVYSVAALRYPVLVLAAAAIALAQQDVLATIMQHHPSSSLVLSRQETASVEEYCQSIVDDIISSLKDDHNVEETAIKATIHAAVASLKEGTDYVCNKTNTL